MNTSTFHRLTGRVVLILLVVSIFLFAYGCSPEKPAKSKLKIGDSAPAFSTVDLNGNPVSMDSYKGHPVALRFWETDCQYCRADTPIFNRYYEKYKDAGLKVVYINNNSSEEEVREFVKDLDIVFPVVMDKDGAIADSYDVRIEPQTVLINPDHKIISAILGGVSEEEFENLVGGYLQKEDRQ